MFVFYFASSRVIRSVPYGKKPRQRLDIFVPKNHWKLNDGLIPVVIYVTGVLQPLTCTLDNSYTQDTKLDLHNMLHSSTLDTELN